MSRPAKRLAPRHPAPLDLTPPREGETPASVNPDDAQPQPQTLNDVVTQYQESIINQPGGLFAPEQGIEPENPAWREDADKLAAALADAIPTTGPDPTLLTTEAVELTPGELFLAEGIQALIQGVGSLMTQVETLTRAVELVGQQQQWTTDTIGDMHRQFTGMMAGGNPLKMISAMMGGMKTPKVGNGNG